MSPEKRPARDANCAKVRIYLDLPAFNAATSCCVAIGWLAAGGGSSCHIVRGSS